MELKGNGVDVSINTAKQSDDWILGAAQEIADVARERGLELPSAAGALAAKGARLETGTEADTTVEALPPPTKESIAAQQLGFASKGYRATLLELNSRRHMKDVLSTATEEEIASEFEAWITEGRITYMAEQQEADPDLVFDLVATPNAKATAEEVIQGAQNFGIDQPYSTEVQSDILKQCTPEEVSGTDPSNGNKVQFSLVPRKLNPKLYGTTEFQKAKLAEIQVDNPFVRATSPLEDLTRLFTLRAQGVKLEGSGMGDLTYSRNFTIKPKLVDGDDCVPSSVVGEYGGLYLRHSGVQHDSNARVAVG